GDFLSAILAAGGAARQAAAPRYVRPPHHGRLCSQGQGPVRYNRRPVWRVEKAFGGTIMTRAVWLAVLLSVGVSPPVLRAQDGKPPDMPADEQQRAERVRMLIKEGGDLKRSGKPAEACAKFTQALDLAQQLYPT